MLKQIFRKSIENELLFNFLEKFCIKTDKYFLFDINAYRKMIFHNYQETFLTMLLEYYHISKQFYLTRKVTNNSIINILRQICKNNSIMFTSKIKYNESKYNIDYYIYFTT